jgi:hypothetical protein
MESTFFDTIPTHLRLHLKTAGVDFLLHLKTASSNLSRDSYADVLQIQFDMSGFRPVSARNENERKSKEWLRIRKEKKEREK